MNISDPEAMMDDVVNMTDRCRKENNSCCGPQFFEKMTDFYVSGNKSVLYCSAVFSILPGG